MTLLFEIILYFVFGGMVYDFVANEFLFVNVLESDDRIMPGDWILFGIIITFWIVIPIIWALKQLVRLIIYLN